MRLFDANLWAAGECPPATLCRRRQSSGKALHRRKWGMREAESECLCLALFQLLEVFGFLFLARTHAPAAQGRRGRRPDSYVFLGQLESSTYGSRLTTVSSADRSLRGHSTPLVAVGCRIPCASAPLREKRILCALCVFLCDLCVRSRRYRAAHVYASSSIARILSDGTLAWMLCTWLKM